ncbi:MAG TPA: type II toxin-antitoxin system ParD family antitoxin [Rhizomicrobium sp.]|jgi:antitoxin ParD1/3/4|nr:type II toxin-antitoxin system ParD family antitoxin [Rhizomicrobium sp.]
MPTRNVVVTQHQAELIETLVSEGLYQNASEVLRDGLRLIEARDAEHKAKIKALREAAQIGIDDIEAGRYVEFQSFEELEKYMKSVSEPETRGKAQP